MAFEHAPEDHSPRLPPGTQIGDWRVLERQGAGAYGVVYRAVRVGQEDAGPVALKLAVYPGDLRFMREVGLLSRIQHPSVPALLGHGLWRHAFGAEHPYFVMEWVEGTPLYAWAEQHAPSSRQVLRVLAQLARALEATHAHSAVHRDVKGGNVLLGRSDGRAVLIDFGSGYFQGAPRLTWQSLPPGTVEYRSPEACSFLLSSVRSATDWYQAAPADDLFALGVTAYRLVTGQYPPSMKLYQDEVESWHLGCPDPRPLLRLNPRVDPRLRELILRVLSESPEARGTAAELAQALEVAGERAGPEADLPLRFAQAPQPSLTPREDGTPSGAVAFPRRSGLLARALKWRPWLALAAMGLLWGFVWGAQALHTRLEGMSVRGQEASASEVPDAGTAALGDSSLAASLASVQEPSEAKAMARDMPFKLLPGQSRPDEKGRCPGRKQVAMNGGCWVDLFPMDADECAENGYVYNRGRCYAPAIAPPSKPPPTSSPSDSR
ncbi:serine/threonine protein kinase [Hyalangium rubrum]|uniref:Serine/threonine-protein kinase n=1 Tax=Hyalangium rubrum TaxID=3103134 RepID=A0ABU5H9U6_9BACT|nr:serine/threonine-protein kinase [Hyalangium sp. s54d21]MDY7230254.1 serine/threonine-protein kinase [Hyalangium sp. s54d21]